MFKVQSVNQPLKYISVRLNPIRPGIKRSVRRKSRIAPTFRRVPS